MLTLVVFNTAGFTLFPSSILMLRHDFESGNLYAFYPYMIVISIVVLIAGLLIQRSKSMFRSTISNKFAMGLRSGEFRIGRPLQNTYSIGY